MAAERWLVVLLVLCCSNHGGALIDVRVMDLTKTKDDSKAISLAVNEPNGENMEKTYYNEEKREKLEHKTWSNQCMRGGSRTPMENGSKGTYNENFENEIYEGHGRRKIEEKVTRSYENNSYVEVEQKEGHYLMDGVYMNVEGEMNVYDKGLKEDTIDGKDLATMNRFYEYVNEVVYMVNFVYNNLDEYLTAELYMVEVVEEIIEENLVNNIEEMNYNEMEEEVVILDSGSDVSLLPRRHQRNLEGSTLGCRLQNCQGGTLEVAGVKHAELHVQARGGQGAVLQHRFVVGDVQSCIMSLGELYQAGWHIDKDGDELSLLPPDDSMKVPVFYKNKSLAIRAHVRCIQEVLQEEEAGMVRAVIQLNDNFNLEQFNRWQTTTDGVPYLLTKRSRFADPRPVFGGLWSYRSTFYKRIEEGRWYVAEIGNKFMDNEEPIMDEGGIEAMPVDNEDDGFLGVVQLQPEQDLRHGGDLRPEEVQGEQQEVEGHEIAVPVEAEAEEDRVVVGDMELTRYSMIRDLRRACRYLGVSQAGSKEKLLKRLVDTNRIALRRQALEVAQRQYEGEMVQAEVVQPAARLPTPHERKMHEATHLPFRQWCGHCVAAKSKDNVHKHQEDDQRERPTVQVDFGHAECGEVLIAVDYWTKTCMAEVMSKKSVNAIGESLANFLGELNYGEAIEICCDNEPVLAAGVKLTKDIRTRNGLETIVTCGKAYDKGRTSAAERYIRILRNQAKCIVSFVEEKVKVKIPPDAMLQAWAFQHGSWLVNKRICTFGESVYGHDAKQSKYRLQWRKGLWLGKDSFGHDLVAVGDNEVLRCKAVRKASEEWDGEAILGLKVSPENLRRGSKTVLKQGRLPPVDVQLLGGPPHDKDAEDVKKYAEQNPNEDKELDTGGEQRDGEQGEAGQVGGEAMEEEALPSRASSSMAAHPRGSMQAGEALLLLQGGQAMDTMEQGQRREVPEGSEESAKKAQRLDEETPISEPESKKSKTLYPPTFAGQVRQVIEDVEIYVDEEEEVEWQIEDEIDLTEYTEKDGPPEVSKEQLEELDREAMLKEVEKLKDMKVIGSIPPEMSVDDALQLDTKNVFDWRFRQNQWTRRCRIVAREFKDSVSTVDTFAPTTPWSAVRTLLALGTVMKLKVAVFDVSDAFLLVPQQEFVIIKVPGWIQQLQPDGEPVEEFWMLRRCLPGQRNAALRWSDYFGGLAKERNFEACKSIPTIYRHQQRQMLMNVHIDDILLIGTTKDCEWFEEEFSKVLKMKKDGPCGIGDNQTVMYLKRELEFRNNEFYLRTNRKYVPKLAKMMEVTERRNKTLPYHPGLDTYDPKSVDEKELLNEEDAKKFRSGLGICLYLSHDRIDIQFAVKILSSYMSRPTKNAYCGLRKLACYLKSTADFEIEFSGSYEYQSIFDRWGQHEGDPQRRARYNLELFSDSDWATSKSSRKSTSAGIMFLNGLMIHSHSRSQTSIALSSCEAELLAATGLLAEGLQLKQLVRFCLRIEESKFENDEEVEMKLYLDSTSAQAMISRLGPGRSKHISTRLLWSQQALRKLWFKVGRISTDKNVADLNTKTLSLKRRQTLLRRCGCRGDGIPEGDDEEMQLGGQQKQLVRAVAALLAVHLQGCGGDSNEGFKGLGSHTVRIDIDEEERNIRRNNLNYLMMATMTTVFAVVISWRFTTTYFPRTTSWIWSMIVALTSRMWRLLQRRVRGDQGQQVQQEARESDGETFDFQGYSYVERFAGVYEMRVYNIEYDRMFIVRAVCPGGSCEEDIPYGFVYYKLENGSWKIKVKGERNRENPEQKWKFFMELSEEDAASAWTRRKEILPRGYVEKRQYPDEFMEMMTREAGIVMAGGNERRARFNECMEDELPGGHHGENEAQDCDYSPTTPEDEVQTIEPEQRARPRQIGEIQPGDGDEGMDMEEYPPPSDAADSDDRGPHGDRHVPGAYEAGDLTREEEMEVMYGNREERERLFREADEIVRQGREAQREVDEMIRQREQARGSGDVDMENQELLEASTTPTSLEEPQFYTNMVDELREGVDPFSRIVIEAAMEASNLALSTNGDDLEVMMRIIRDTAMEAHQEERTPRQRLRIWRRRFRARLEGCGIWQRSLTQAEMRERSRSRTTRGSRTSTRRTLAEGEEEEPEAEGSEQGETEQQQMERYRNSTMDEVSDPELWQTIHH
eukprot:symbB.v1.2.011770.t1/scaffold750.1/size323489/22